MMIKPSIMLVHQMMLFFQGSMGESPQGKKGHCESRYTHL